MPDAADLAKLEASIRATADTIIAGFKREHVPNDIALAICGVVVATLLDQGTHATFDQFIAALEYRRDHA